MKNFIEVNRRDYLNMIFNKLIENVEQMKLKNQKQSDIRSFFRSWNIFYLYSLLVSYEKKILHLNFFAQKIQNSSGHVVIADTFLGTAVVRFRKVWLYFQNKDFPKLDGHILVWLISKRRFYILCRLVMDGIRIYGVQI